MIVSHAAVVEYQSCDMLSNGDGNVNEVLTEAGTPIFIANAEYLRIRESSTAQMSAETHCVKAS
jgi:hypothetical protein